MRLLSIVAALAAAASLGVSVNTAWAHTELLDAQAYMDNIADPMLADSTVKDAVATELANETLNAIDLGEGFAQLVPTGMEDMVQLVGDEIEAQWKSQLRPAIRAQLDTPEFRVLWDRANRAMHGQLIDALGRSGTGSTVTLDLHAVLLLAVHNVGVEVERSIGLPFVADIFDEIGEALPADVGRMPVDVSDIGGPSRFLIRNANAIFLVTGVVGVAALALALAAARRRGPTLIAFGSGLALMALGSYLMVATSSVGAGDKFAARALAPVSVEMRQLVDTQAALVVDTFRPWAGGLGLAGVAILVVGVVWSSRGRRTVHRSVDGLVPAAKWPEPEKSTEWKLPDQPPSH